MTDALNQNGPCALETHDRRVSGTASIASQLLLRERLHALERRIDAFEAGIDRLYELGGVTRPTVAGPRVGFGEPESPVSPVPALAVVAGLSLYVAGVFARLVVGMAALAAVFAALGLVAQLLRRWV